MSLPRRARAATTVVFLLTGAVMAGWATRLPAVQERLGLSTAEVGLAVTGLELGAVSGLPLGGLMVSRLGSAGATRIGLAVYPGALLAAAVAQNLPLLAGALAVTAAANSVVDVAVNVQGLELERRYGRPVLSSLHAGHSAGLLTGGLTGTVAAAGGVSVGTHFAVVAVVGTVLGVVVPTWFVAERTGGRGTAFARPDRRLLLLGLLAFCAFLLDGAASSWSALHVRTAYDATPATAAAAFTVFAVALTIGRLGGDRVIARLGREHTVLVAGLTTAAGCALAISAPNPAGSLAGWGVFGLGLATIAPAVLGASAAATQRPPAAAIAAVSTVGYLGSFTGPPVVGAVATTTSLSTALTVLVAVALTSACLARPALRTTEKPDGGPR
ncbi:MFS transporter [Actinophytocola gossypii]|uniref:MFS transporter n=1 Tax=Actinophytocola gossypii TaxID=2812003 RepID=A0ABT2J9N1_9PSEU|nr:MFS transporter [Actinophytocola gossypii]MCT2584578.1 MFS transporter [Actinophytocola gossypii]